MQIALVNGQRTTPTPGLTGTCPNCGAAMIAKCGPLRVFHWAHRSGKHCDSWSERETEWHRNWKNMFPSHWQEIPRLDQFGERHIADVLTEHGLVIEFQHSYLTLEERLARETFYGSMLWIVDGSRLARDLPRFRAGIGSLRRLDKGLYFTPFPEELLPHTWLSCRAPVLFDFGNTGDLNATPPQVSRCLWCLLPGRVLGQAIILKISKDAFVRSAHNRAVPINAEAILENCRLRLLTAQRRLAQLMSNMKQRPGQRRQGFRRTYAKF